MKKALLFFFACTGTMPTLHAQTNQGAVQYDRTISLDINLDNAPPEMAALIPKEQKSAHVLYFTPEASLFESVKQEPQKSEYNSSSDNMQVKISIGSSESEEKTYTDINNKKTVEQKDLMGKKFLVTGSMEKMKWKMTGRQKMLLDYPVQEAVAAGEKDTVTAWFTPQIPVATGPMGLGGLPGLILEAEIGRMIVIKATAVQAGAAAEGKIKQPTKGKSVTSEQFRKVVAEKEKEMAEETGGGTRRVIIKTIGN